MHELILGGQKSGKSRAAEGRALDWLAAGAGPDGLPRQALLLATAWAGDDEMAARIQRHRLDRAARVPGLATLELVGSGGPQHALALAATLVRESRPQRLLVVDCLTLWLTQRAMPPQGVAVGTEALVAECDALVQVLVALPGPVVLVSNEIGLGLSPLSASLRGFVDALGRLHQQVGAVCGRVTLMVAGCALAVKGGG